MSGPCPGCQPNKETQSYQRKLSKEEKKCEKANQRALEKYENQLAKFERARQRKLKQLEKIYISKLEDELVGTGDFSGNPSLMGAPPGDAGDPFDPCCCSGVESPYKSNDPILDRRQDTSNIISIFVKPEQLGLDVSRKKCECDAKACSLRKQVMAICYRYCCYLLTVLAIALTIGTVVIIYLDPIKGLFPMDCNSYEKFRKWQRKYAKKVQKQSRKQAKKDTKKQKKYEKKLKKLQKKSDKRLYALRKALRGKKDKIVTIPQCNCDERQRCYALNCLGCMSCTVFIFIFVVLFL